MVYADELSTVDYKHHSLFKELEMSDAQWKLLNDYALSFGTKLIVDVFGLKSLKTAQKININTVANHGIDWKQPISFKKKLINNIPKERMMNSSDLYGIIDYLCSDRNTFMNGSTLVIDGGYTSW